MQTSSPTARPASIKISFAMAAIEKKIIRTFDVKGAYLKSNIEEEIIIMIGEKNEINEIKEEEFNTS